MRVDESPDIEALSWSDAQRVDEVCDCFEESLRAGGRPSIEEHLVGEGSSRTVLLGELVGLDVEYRTRSGEEPSVGEYVERFPEDVALLETVFREVGPTGEGPPSRQEASGREGAVPVDPDAPLPFSDFKLVRKLRETGMSTVWEAFQQSLKRRVAVKVLRKDRSVEPARVARFLREARALARFRHTHVVGVLGVGRTDDDGYFLVMDFLEGIDLDERIQSGPVSAREAARILATVADAVQHAHDHGVIHRDLKPANVLLEEGRRPVLIDFGLARLLQGDSVERSRDDILGTLPFMPPEQADPRRGTVGPRTDVFGLGAILYALLTREPPFPGKTVTEILEKVTSEEPPPSPSSLSADVPPELERICLTCLAKDPAARLASAGEVATRLREWLSERQPPRDTETLATAIGGRLQRATDSEAVRLIRVLRGERVAAAVRPLIRCLRRRRLDVRREAGRALLAIGWRTVAAEIERMARRGEVEDLDIALHGLAAFKAHPDTVGLLERLIPALQGSLRNRAVLLLERKRLALATDRVRAILEASDRPFRIEKALGQGPFTACYLANDERFGLPVVLRVLRPEFTRQPEVVGEFLDLGRESYRLVHQNLLAVRDVGSVPDHELHYIVRDYVEGVTLQQLLETGKRFTVAQVVELLLSIAAALGPVHRQGLVHGGIKPSNVFVHEDGQVFLGDRTLPLFKCQVALDRLSYDFLYTAPEVGTADSPPGPASDLYSLGCVAFELISGRPPFVAESPMQLVVKHARDPVPELSVAPDVDVDDTEVDCAREVIRRLLAKRPEERFESVDHLVRGLGLIGRQPVVGLVSSGPEPLATRSLVGQLQPSVLSMEPPSSRESTLARGERGAPVVGERPEIESAAEEMRRRGYRVVSLLGRGGMGVVFEGVHESLDRKVALKVVRYPRCEGEDDALTQFVRRFQRESRIMARLSHPTIVPIYDLFEAGDHLVIAMAFVEGGSLAERLASSKLSLCDALLVAEGVAKALAHAHAHGVIHRDVKPGNILLDEKGNPLLADFGLAGFGAARRGARLLESSISSSWVSTVRQVVGTPAYMSPEQHGAREITDRADVFSLGVTLFEMLTGERPFQENSPYEVISKTFKLEVPSLRKAAPDIPRALDALVGKMLHATPEKRPDAASVARSLGKLRSKHCRG